MELGPDVPDAVRDVVDHFHELHMPDKVPPAVKKIYQRGQRGKCMLCTGVLKEQTVVIINALGLVEIYCSHKCIQDMNVRGWIEEQYDHIADAIKFRGTGSPSSAEAPA